MAAKKPFNQTLRTRIREDHLTCSICFGDFDQPKALPCLHTFCLDCIRDFVTGRNFEAVGKFPCPVCRNDTPIPPQGVHGFPDNHLVASLSDTMDRAGIQTPVPPHPTQDAINTAQAQYGRTSPAQPGQASPAQPGRVSPAPPIPPRPTNASPTPANQGAPNGSHGTHSHQLSNLFTSGINTAVGKVGAVISDATSYLYPPKPQETVEPPSSPYEYVDQSGQVTGQSYPGLYPQLSNTGHHKGPGTDKMLIKFGKFGPGISNFLKPYGLATGQNGEFVISDRGGNRIFVFSNNGEHKLTFNTEKCIISDVAVTKDNNILVAVSRSGSSIMRMYTMNGRFMQQYGDFYAYDVPSGITVTPQDHVAITNLAADNVLVFTDKRKFSVKFGWKGKGDKHFSQPQFVAATHKDYIVVSDTGNNSIKVYDIAGNFKRSFGGTGSSHGQLNSPLGVTTDSMDFIIVADSNNFRVDVFTVKGVFYTTLLKDTNLIGPDVKPINVAVTSRNNVAVLLFGTGFAEVRVYHWRPSSDQQHMHLV